MGHETDKCTFCLLSAHKELAERGITRDMPEFAYYTNLLSVENVNHLFWECEHVSKCIHQCYRWIRGFDWYHGNEEISKSEFFMGIEKEDVSKKTVLSDILWKHYVKFFIYQFRQQRRVPTFPSLKFELEGLFSGKKMEVWRNHLLRNWELYGN